MDASNFDVNVTLGTYTISKKEITISYNIPHRIVYGDVYGLDYEITADANLAFNDYIELNNITNKDAGNYNIGVRINDENANDVSSNYIFDALATLYS